MNDQARIRVNGASLSHYLGKPVILLGEFIQLESNGRIFTVKSPSNDVITVQLQEPVQELLEGIVQVQGTVCPNNVIQCQHLVNLPGDLCEKIDMSLYNEVISMASRLPTNYVIVP